LLKIGVVNDESWAFFGEIAAELAAHHMMSVYAHRELRLPVFRERVSRWWERSRFREFLDAQDVTFFEWASGALAAASNLRSRCKIVTRLHRYELYEWADRIQWEAVDRVILVSRAKEREFLSRFPDQQGKTIVVPEAIPLERFPYRPRATFGTLGTLCHLAPRKRVYELILAFSEAARSNRHLMLHIGGAAHPRFPDYEPALQSLVRRLNLGERVVFHGAVTDPSAWYSEVDLFISNSYSEGLQVAPMEAIASGADCLSHAWDGADELLPQEHLFHTEAELLQKLGDYCQATQEERWRRQALLREKVVAEFDMRLIRRRVRDVVETVAAG
jgi:glycosyltransferase involved in cell wall biosynthesis